MDAFEVFDLSFLGLIAVLLIGSLALAICHSRGVVRPLVDSAIVPGMSEGLLFLKPCPLSRDTEVEGNGSGSIA